MNTRTRTINSDTTITNRLLGGFRRGLHSPSWRVLALIVAPVFSYAQFVPTHFTAQMAYAGTNSGFSYLDQHNDALNGAPATFFENTSKTGSGGEYAWVQREGIIDSTQVWLKTQSSTTQRSSTSADGWYDFQVTTDRVRLDWTVIVAPLVWWDQALVRVYNMSAGGILISHSTTGVGYDELTVTPGHTLRLYAGFNQNNLNQFSYPAGNTAFLAEGRLSAPIQAFQGRVTLQDWQGSMVGELLTVTIRDATNAIVQGPETTTTTTNGSWNLPTSLANGTYKVTVKGRTWLSASVGNVVLSGGSTEVLTTHVNGDSVPDDVIDLSDYTTLILAFNALLDTDPNTAGNQPSPNWNVAADLNGDGAVDLTDYTVIVMNFNAIGGSIIGRGGANLPRPYRILYRASRIKVEMT